MKYIIVKTFDIPVAIVFDELLSHGDVLKNSTAISAGYCNQSGAVWGKSVSLNLKPGPNDSEIINESFKRNI